MTVFVITPYFETSDAWISQAHESVKAQTMASHHILVCDGGRPAQVPDFRGTHIVLQRNYRDYGNTPRLIGCYQAVTQGAEALAFLDGDNWFYPDHIERLMTFARDNNLDAVASARMLHRLDGSHMLKCPVVDGKAYIDTNCLLVLKPAFQHMVSWTLLPQDVAAVTDQSVWRHMLAMGVRMGFLDHPSVAYRTRHASHYEMARETPPPEAVNRRDTHGENYH